MTKKFGKQTPSQSVILDYRESRYQEAVALYKKTKLEVYEWQLNILKDIMAIDERGFGFIKSLVIHYLGVMVKLK